MYYLFIIMSNIISMDFVISRLLEGLLGGHYQQSSEGSTIAITLMVLSFIKQLFSFYDHMSRVETKE